MRTPRPILLLLLFQHLLRIRISINISVSSVYLSYKSIQSLPFLDSFLSLVFKQLENSALFLH